MLTLNGVQLNFIPSDWPTTQLGTLFEIQQGKAIGKKARKGESLYPFLRTANIHWGKLNLSQLDTMDFNEKERKRLTLAPGDLLICEGGDIGRTSIWMGEIENCYYQNHLHRLRAKRGDIEPEFYMRWLEAAFKLLGLYVGEGNITTIPNLSKSRLSSFTVPFPPLPEQRAIAYVLRTVQRAIEATEKVIAATKELNKSLTKHLFTYGPVPIDQIDKVKLKQTEIGLIPEHWEVVSIGELGDVRTGKTPPTKQKKYWDGPIPFITPIDLIGSEVRDVQRSVSKEALEILKPLPAGTVLVSCIGYIGKVGIVTDEIAVTNQQINAIIPFSENVEPWFLLYALLKENHRLVNTAAVTTIPIVNKSNFKAFVLPLPPLEEQQAIADILCAVQRVEETNNENSTSLRALFSSLLHNLMTGKIRVRDIEEVLARAESS